MPKHKFIIISKDQIIENAQYNYNPDNCKYVFVNDNDILPLLDNLKEIKCYWHSLNRPEYGLAYHGITLIPPETISTIIEIIWNNNNLSELFSLLLEAQRDNYFIIHFGI